MNEESKIINLYKKLSVAKDVFSVLFIICAFAFIITGVGNMLTGLGTSNPTHNLFVTLNTISAIITIVLMVCVIFFKITCSSYEKKYPNLLKK